MEDDCGYFGYKWSSLVPSTIQQRQRRGKWPGKIMHMTERLKSSFT